MSAVRNAIESQYKGVCTISEYQPVKDPVTKRTTQQETGVLIDQPCKVSFKTVTATNEDGNVSTTAQIIKLFIAPEIVVKPGSKITITQNGVTADYSQSGYPAIYTNHQEIILELFGGWA